MKLDNAQKISSCERVNIAQGAFYLGKSTKTYSQGYLELNPFCSLQIHNRENGIENLLQIKNNSVLIIFSNDKGKNHLLKPKHTLKISPQGVWHIHANPFSTVSLTYWYFEGDIRAIINSIRNKA